MKSHPDPPAPGDAVDPAGELRPGEATYRLLVEHLPAVTYVAPVAPAPEGGAIAYVSPQIEALLGFTQAEWMADPQRWLKRLHPEDRERVRQELAASHAGDGRFTSEYRLLARDGRVVWVRDEAAVVAAGPGGARFSQGVWLDITDRKRAETAHAQLVREQAAREAATQRSARLRALHEAALMIAAPVPVEPGAVAALLGKMVERAVAAVSGRDGRLVLAEDMAWRDLAPGSVAAEGFLMLDHAGRLRRALSRRDGATRHVLATGEAVEVPDTLAPSRFGPYTQLAQVGVRSLVMVPLRASGQVVGVLSVTFNHAGSLSDEHRESLELFAAHAATALERVRQAYADRRRASQAEELAATLAQVGAAADLEGAVAALLRGALNLLRADQGVARIFGSGGHRRSLRLVLSREGALKVDRRPRALRPGSFGATLEAGGPAALVEDFLALDPAAYPLYEAMQRQGMRSSVNVPIDAAGQRIGSLHLDHHQPGFFGPADLSLAEALAAQAGAAIERARLEAAREAAQRDLAAREAEAAALRELDRLKNELLQTITHELRTPLTTVHGYAELLHLRAADLEPARVQRMAQQIYVGARQLARLVDDLLDFGRIQRGEVALHPEDFDLAPVLHDVLAGFRHQPGGERLVAEAPERLPVRADPARITQVISNLISNALKYAPAGPVVLRAGPAKSGPGAVRLEVEDRGPGIPRHEQRRVWEKFFRGTGVAELNVARGSGIGLAVVKMLVEEQGGRVGLDSVPGRGARFWFEVPAAGAPAAPPGAPLPPVPAPAARRPETSDVRPEVSRASR